MNRTTALAAAATSMAMGAALFPSPANAYPGDHEVQSAREVGISSAESRLIAWDFGAGIRLTGGRGNELAAFASYHPDVLGFGSSASDGQEILGIEDMSADGKRVAARWSIVGGGKSGICINTNGHNDSKFSFCGLPIGEGRTIRIRPGKCDGSTSPCNSYDDWTWSTETDWYAVNGWIDYNDDADTNWYGDCDERDRTGDC